MSTYFDGLYLDAERVQKKGLNSEIFYRFVCALCRKHVKVPLQCSGCHSVKYCGRDCQKKAWKNQGYYKAGHKEECEEIKGYMKEFGELQAIVKQFPWAVLSEKEGLFNYELGLAMHKVLGTGTKFGFWTLDPPDLDVDRVVQKTLGANRPLTYDSWGRILLSNKNFDEKTGWKLPAEDTPWLTFGKDRNPPSFPPTFEQNWTSYYEWRGLPLKSPAALLLHWPLSIYRCLYLLGFVSTDTGGTERRKLTIHWLGVEVETNFLPIFGELALLFPNTDIDMIAFGQYPYDRAREAKPNAIAAREYVYEYQAPEQCGSGSIRIQLYKSSPIWDPADIISREAIPDVIIGLNAGLSTYETWYPVFLTSRALSIPFAITEFTRISLAEAEYHYTSWIATLKSKNVALLVLLGLEKLGVLLKSIDHPPSSAINPFMRPGPIAAMTSSIPRGINGFTCIVTPRAETRE